MTRILELAEIIAGFEAMSTLIGETMSERKDTSELMLGGDYEELGEYLRILKDMMGLRDWEIRVVHEPTKREDHAATIETWYGSQTASIWFARNWAEGTPEELRETCVHELVHCHINPIRVSVENIQENVGQMMYIPLYADITNRLEYAVDGIASAWAPHLPLPGEEWTA